MAKRLFPFKRNSLYSGDCLEVMQEWVARGYEGVVDLIYLDPPFNSGRNYNVLFGKDTEGRDLDERAQFVAFGDTWHYTNEAHLRVQRLMKDPHNPACKVIQGFNLIIPESPTLAYLSYMAERLVVAYDLLSERGSLYLHCDPTASHYLKIILDEIFGRDNFKNEIVWHYQTGGASKKHFAKKHDVILFYSKSQKYFIDLSRIKIPRTEKSLKRAQNPKGARISKSDTDKYPNDVFVDIQALNPMEKERMGYPTQKPTALLERIIKASSDKNDVVLDPFCGCGTTMVAAHKLQRQFIGIDISLYALNKVSALRLKDAKFKIYGVPTTLDEAAKMEPFKFEQWAVTLMQGFEPNNKQVGDGGVDGRAWLLEMPAGEDGLVIAQVKQGNLSVDAQRALLSQIAGGKASVGIFVTLYKMKDTPTVKECIRAAGTYKKPGGEVEYPRLVYWSIEEYFAGVKPPLQEMLPAKAEQQTDILSDGEAEQVKSAAGKVKQFEVGETGGE